MRNSDRLATPSVVITGLLVAGLLVGGTVAAVTYLTAQGLDPEPVFKLAGLAVTACASLGGFVLQLVNRTTIAKAEKNTGTQAGHIEQLASAVWEVADALPRPVPPSRHAYEETLLRKTAPAPPRS
jgi:hypothetical protein